MAVPVAFFQVYLAHIWSQRPRDVEYRPFISIQMALDHFRTQPRISREALAERLEVNNSLLARIEARGNLNEKQLNTLIRLCEEYFMPNLMLFFEGKLKILLHPHVDPFYRGGRRKMTT